MDTTESLEWAHVFILLLFYNSKGEMFSNQIAWINSKTVQKLIPKKKSNNFKIKRL